MKPVVELTGLTVRRGDTVILDNVNWRVDAGQHWAVLGPNGCGKTSLLHTLMSYLSPTLGDITVLGERFGAYDWRELRRRVGIVSTAVPNMMPPSEPGLNVIYSGKDAMIGAWGEVDHAAVDRAEELLARVQCTHLESRPWRVLSQGERQRLLIGRALMANPELLILDEPCSGLDPAAREHFLSFVEELARTPDTPTLLLVTHHVEEITPAYTHVLLLKDGKVLEQGEKSVALTSATLSAAFSSVVTLREVNGRYTLSFQQDSGRIV